MSVVADLFVRNARDISREATNDPLLHVGVQLRFEVRPIHVVTPDNQSLPEASSKSNNNRSDIAL